jgi:hypothetical protein
MTKRAAHISIVATAYKGPVLRLQLNQEDRPGRLRIRRDGHRSRKLGDSITNTEFSRTLAQWIARELPKAALRELNYLCNTNKSIHPRRHL